ncbi:LOW QUALITY PROTEIN: hypothetical protein V2J09_023935 [Rumex salicifolius]
MPLDFGASKPSCVELLYNQHLWWFSYQNVRTANARLIVFETQLHDDEATRILAREVLNLEDITPTRSPREIDQMVDEARKSSNKVLGLSQRSYIQDILDYSKMSNSSSVSTPADPQLVREGEPFSDPKMYRRTVGSLQYATITRPDIAYSISRACQFMHSPTTLHWCVVKWILRYLNGTKGHCLHFSHTSAMSLMLAGSRTRMTAIFHGTNLISWTSPPPLLLCDNVGAVFLLLAQGPNILHLIFISSGSKWSLELSRLPCLFHQQDDIFTKSLSKDRVATRRSKLQVRPVLELAEG